MSLAAAHLLNHRLGVLNADGAFRPVRFIIDGVTGDLVFPAALSVTESEELVLHIPREQPDGDRELQLLLSARAIEASGVCDRWAGYHGPPDRASFVSCRIESAKFDAQVVDAAELALVNTIRADESRLRKRANSDKARLRSACVRRAGVPIPEPVVVGVDQFGVDVRATLGIVRIPFAWMAADGGDADRCLEDLLGGGP